MDKVSTIIDKIISGIAVNFSRILFAVIIIGMFFINSVYLYIDKPDFRMNNIYNYLGITINIVLLIGIIVFGKYIRDKLKNNKKIYIIFFLIYFIFEIGYILLVPLKPFSDMKSVTDIALANFNTDIHYLQIYPNNLPITIVFNIIFRITGYNVISLKIFNIICNIFIIYVLAKIYENIYKRENNVTLIFGLFGIATFLYVNNTYNDIVFTILIMIALYFITKQYNNKFDIVIISVILFLQYIIRPVGIIVVIATIMYYLLKNKNKKNVIAIVSIFIICNLIYVQVEKRIIPDSQEKYPIWSFIQMGLNEEEFGFQDGSHSKNWTFIDVKNRINDFGPIKLMKLLCKKQYWLWTEGTYQVERYAFGDGNSGLFEYETNITKRVNDAENSKLRKCLDYIMKGQYFVLILLSLAELVLRDELKSQDTNGKREMLLYIMIGLFCFYMIWEIKSRYIYCLYPIFNILSANGFYKITNLIKSKGEIKNGKI